MAYLPVDNTNDKQIHDLLRRKEFYSLKADDKYRTDATPQRSRHLKLRSYQLFARNYANTDTPYKCLQLSHSTGAGKTKAACAIATEFIDAYKRIYAAAAQNKPMRKKQHHYAELAAATPTVFVLGFGGTKAAFVRELMSHPEFGFVSFTEISELARRHGVAAAGLADDIKYYTTYYSSLKKRITNKSRGGFYKFYGYDEFVNRLFYSSTTKLVDIDADHKSRYNAAIRAGIASNDLPSLEDVFNEYLADGRLQVNESMLALFENSLLICDEIHNTYNTDAKNNRGIAIQYLRDHVPTLRFLTLSATLINNSPTEIIETINYLVPGRITKREFFADSRTLHPGKLQELGRLTRGYISFLQDTNIEYYPERIFDGVTLSYNGVEVPYLKFTPCIMSPFHTATYQHYRDNKHDMMDGDDDDDDLLSAENGMSLVPTDGYTMYDMVFPNPEDPDHGLFRSSDIRTKLMLAPQAWQTSMKITTKRTHNPSAATIITGEFLRADNIAKYSTKYSKLLSRIFEVVAIAQSDPARVQKIMIYHDRKIMSGAYLIQELLWHNGVLDEVSAPVDSTRCCVCGETLRMHTDVTSASLHEFRPMRFVVAHSDIDKPTMDASLAKYNAADNCNGLNFQILIGSKIIKESYDFKDIRRLFLVSLPVNIPTMIQVFGRAIRTNSHINLPPDQRNVHIEIFVSVFEHEPSPEMQRYIDKLADYKTIQLIEREININAIDGDLHRDIITNNMMSTDAPTIGNLAYTPAYQIPEYRADELNTTTFKAYRHMRDEINTITYLIKRLFMNAAFPAYTYIAIWEAMRTSTGIETNPALFSEECFVIALHNLTMQDGEIIIGTDTGATCTNLVVDSLFDYNEKRIYARANKYDPESVYIPHRIKQCGDQYILFPMEGSRVVVDAGVYMAYRSRPTTTRINLGAYLVNDRATINYESDLSRFTAEYKSHPNLTSLDFAALFFDFPAEFQQKYIEEIISGENTDEPHKMALDIIDQFGAIIYGEETIRYADVGKHYLDISAAPKDKPVGYESAKIVRIYDQVAKHWFEVNKLALNRHITYRENNVIVGYYESAGDDVRFKLRKPAHILRAELSADTRFLERGMVCTTRGKQSLLEILASLGVSVRELGETRVRNLCDMVKHRLFELELKERKKNTAYKWLYSWWTEPVKFR